MLLLPFTYPHTLKSYSAKVHPLLTGSVQLRCLYNLWRTLEIILKEMLDEQASTFGHGLLLHPQFLASEMRLCTVMPYQAVAVLSD